MKIDPREFKDLQEPYKNWSTEGLVRATTLEKDDYQRDALSAMLAELERRQVSALERETLEEQIRATMEAEKRGVFNIRRIMASNWPSWFSPITSRDDARKALHECVSAFYGIAALQADASFFLGAWTIVDAVLFAVLALWLSRRNSRIAAAVLFLQAIFSLGTTAMNRFGGGEGGRNIGVALIVLWASIRAVQATAKLSALTPPTSEPDPSTAFPPASQPKQSFTWAAAIAAALIVAALAFHFDSIKQNLSELSSPAAHASKRNLLLG